ncbi:MAG: hypothetical protein ACU837_03200 [Gammaproteobacteria bacterium]
MPTPFGITVDCDEPISLLELAEAHGIEIEYSPGYAPHTLSNADAPIMYKLLSISMLTATT